MLVGEEIEEMVDDQAGQYDLYISLLEAYHLLPWEVDELDPVMIEELGAKAKARTDKQRVERELERMRREKW